MNAWVAFAPSWSAIFINALPWAKSPRRWNRKQRRWPSKFAVGLRLWIFRLPLGRPVARENLPSQAGHPVKSIQAAGSNPHQPFPVAIAFGLQQRVHLFCFVAGEQES